MKILINSKITASFLTILPLSAIFFTVFIIVKDWDNEFVSRKYFWFYLSIGLCSLTFFLIAAISQKKHQFNILDGLIFLWGITSLLFNNYIHNAEAITNQILLILIIVLYYYFRLAFQHNKYSVYCLTICFIITELVEATWGLRQLYGLEQSQHSLFRLTGSFFNPGPYACYIAIVFPMSLYYALKYKICQKVKFHFRNMPIYFLWGISLLTVLASILVLPATMSRASWLAAVGGCGFVLLFFFTRNRKVKIFIVQNKKKCVLIASGVILFIVAGGFGAYQLKKDSADGRTFIWKNTLELIKQNPLGVGLGNFSGSYGHVQAAYFEVGNGTEDEDRVAGNPEYAYNEYLQICAEQGIIVFLLFIGIVGYSLYIGIKRKKIAATASLVALLLAASTSYLFSVLPFLIVFVFLLALINRDEKGIIISKAISVVLVFCSLIIVSLCLYNRYPTYDAYKKWNKLKYMYNFGNHREAVNEYRAVYPFLSDQIQFLFEYAQCLSKSEQYEESNKVLERAVKISCDPMLYNIMGKNYQAMKQYAEAERCFIKSSHIVPNRIYPYYLMALMYMDTGETEKAKAVAQIVLTKEPKVQSTAVQEMRNEARKIMDND